MRGNFNVSVLKKKKHFEVNLEQLYLHTSNNIRVVNYINTATCSPDMEVNSKTKQKTTKTQAKLQSRTSCLKQEMSEQAVATPRRTTWRSRSGTKTAGVQNSKAKLKSLSNPETLFVPARNMPKMLYTSENGWGFFAHGFNIKREVVIFGGLVPSQAPAGSAKVPRKHQGDPRLLGSIRESPNDSTSFPQHL